MMNKPTLSELMSTGMDSKYTLVVAIAKRARRIAAGEDSLVEVDTDKPVSLAANEIVNKKVTYYRDSDYDEIS